MDFGTGLQPLPERTRAERIVAQLFDLPDLRTDPDRRVTEFEIPDLQPSGGEFATMALLEPDEFAESEEDTSDVFLDDAIEDVGICKRLAGFCSDRGLPIYCVGTGGEGTEWIPVLLQPDEAEKLEGLGGMASRAALAEAAGIHLLASTHVDAFSPGDAIRFFKKGLAASIAVRLAASTASATSTGYEFELSTKTASLSAFWTPASGLIKGRFFGYPTSPAKGKLVSGKFCFGAGTNGGSATYDMTTFFDIPTLSQGYIDI